MSKNNYTQNNEFVSTSQKITITDYVLNNSKEIRQNHIDLSNPCLKASYERDHGKDNEEMSTCHQMRVATKNTKQYLNLIGQTSSKIHTCHLCENNSSAPNGFICTAPTHIYFGTNFENQNDIDRPEKQKHEPVSRHEASKRSAQSRKENNEEAFLQGMSDMGKIAASKDNHMNKKFKFCIWCNKSFNLGNFYYHGDNCKLNPSSSRFEKK